MDFYLFNQINQFAGKNVCLDSIAIFFARYFEYVLVFCLLLFLVKNFKRYWPMAAKAFGAAILSRLVITNIIRWIVHRPRPFVDNQVNLLVSPGTESSFPSGHAAFYFAIATIVYFYNKKAGILFFIASFLICLARVFSGIHWPSDILAGAIIGIFSGWLINKFTRKF